MCDFFVRKHNMRIMSCRETAGQTITPMPGKKVFLWQLYVQVNYKYIYFLKMDCRCAVRPSDVCFYAWVCIIYIMYAYVTRYIWLCILAISSVTVL